MQQLETHQTAVLVLVDQIADKGCCCRVRINWQSVDEKVLEIQKSLIARKKLPGADWWPDWYYREQKGEFNADRQAEGHYPFENDGKPGFMIPNAPIVKFRGEEVLAGIQKQKFKSADDIDPASLQQMGADFVNTGFAGALPSSSFSATAFRDSFDEDGDDATPALVPPASRGQAPATPAPSRGQVPATPVPMTPTAGKGKHGKGTNLVLPGETVVKPQHSPKQEAGHEAGKKVAVKKEPGQEAAAAAASSGRGRKPMAWANLVDIEMNTFRNANEHSIMWNGAEITTATKNLTSLEKDTHTHTRMCICMCICTSFPTPCQIN